MGSGDMTATEVAALLDLKPHPEGGYYAETFRDSSVSLTTAQLPPQCTCRCPILSRACEFHLFD
jgi:predicted cupin superfamily sugar epimerase